MISKVWGQKEIDLAKLKYEKLKPTYEIAEEMFAKVYPTITQHEDRDVRKATELLTRLMNGYPLSPITDDPEEWEMEDDGDFTIYRSIRRPSLFKRVALDGDKKCVQYIDKDRYEVIDVNTMSITNERRFCEILLDAADPITMPYFPYAKIKVFTDGFTLGEDEYAGLMYFRAMDGMMYKIDKYYRIGKVPEERTVIEVSRGEFLKKKLVSKDLKGRS